MTQEIYSQMGRTMENSFPPWFNNTSSESNFLYNSPKHPGLYSMKKRMLKNIKESTSMKNSISENIWKGKFAFFVKELDQKIKIFTSTSFVGHSLKVSFHSVGPQANPSPRQNNFQNSPSPHIDTSTTVLVCIFSSILNRS